MADREPVFFLVPKDTAPTHCGSCGALVYWIVTRHGKKMMVDTRVPGGLEPLRDRDGRGWSHFATCPYAGRHRRARPRPVRQVATAQPASCSFGDREPCHCDRKVGSNEFAIARSHLVPDGPEVA